jgi:hypothetical protein
MKIIKKIFSTFKKKTNKKSLFKYILFKLPYDIFYHNKANNYIFS